MLFESLWTSVYFLSESLRDEQNDRCFNTVRKVTDSSCFPGVIFSRILDTFSMGTSLFSALLFHLDFRFAFFLNQFVLIALFDLVVTTAHQ